jgi:hypothetical protein
MARRQPRPYVRPHHYTPDELRAAEIADLETDIRCAERDGLPEYAAECRTKLAKLRGGNADV